jgi:hypothetical protein
VSDLPNIPARPVLQGEAERTVTLREFEQRLSSLQQQINDRIRIERELIETRSNALDKALELAAKETERRLEELNHAHENATANWLRSLPREVFEGTVSEWSKWRDTVNVHVTTMAGMPSVLAAIEVRIKQVETQLQQATGALVLIRFMGFAGVIALLVTFLRMAGVIP